MSDWQSGYLEDSAGGEELWEGAPDEVLSVESERLRLAVRRASGEYQILHKPTGRIWTGPADRLGSLTLNPNDGRRHSGYDGDRWVSSLNHPESAEVLEDSVVLTFVPTMQGTRRPLTIEITLALVSDDDLEFSYRTYDEDAAWSVHSVKLIDDALTIDGTRDYAVVPVHQGEVVPVGSAFSYLPEDRKISTRTSDAVGTYTGVGSWNMAMFALAKGGSTAVITWDDPSVEAGIVGGKDPAEDGGWQIRSRVNLRRDARRVRLHFMEDAGYVEVSRYYRRIAKKRGLFDTFREKIRRVPDLEKNVGAVRFTAFPKWGRARGSGWARFLKTGQSRIDYTFDEVADVNEHLVNDLGVKRGLTIVSAWTRRGYDMDYPDVLPAAEECGGNEGLARASERVRRLGWQFGLHDNSLLQFKECPTTDEANALVRIDGTPVEGGVGFNGAWELYQCCPARMNVTVARNFQAYKELFNLNCVYTDMIAAMPIVECFSPEHPLTHRQAIDTFAEVVEYQRTQVGVVFSEIADEWAVPIFDTMGISMNTSHDFAHPIPLFELVYRECVNLEPWPWGVLSESMIVDCISRGRMPYLTFPNRDYLQNGFDTKAGRYMEETWWSWGYEPENIFLRGDRGWGQDLNEYDRLVKNVYEVTSALNELTLHEQMTDHRVLTEDRKVETVAFADGTRITVNRSEEDYEHEGTVLPSRGFVATGPEFLTFYARRHDGVDYPDGALFAARSLDGKPIAESRKVRVYHGFGEPRIKIGGRTITVEREATVDTQDG